jgi:hypothetical protein
MVLTYLAWEAKASEAKTYFAVLLTPAAFSTGTGSKGSRPLGSPT